MGLAALSEDSKRFLENRIRTPEALEIVLLLRSRPNHDWDSVDVARSVSVEPISVSQHLMSLYTEGVIDHPQTAGRLYQFRYNSGASFRERCLDEIATVFSSARMEVIEHLVATQRRQMHSFAAAFRAHAPHRTDG